LCLASSQNPFEREFFVPVGRHLGVKLLKWTSDHLSSKKKKTT
jgi:hypothetical protein